MLGKQMAKGLAVMLAKGAAIGLANALFFSQFMNNLVLDGKGDEVAISTYAINFFVGWVFFSAWFLAKADEEWKKVSEAVLKSDRETFMVEAPKRIALSIRILYLMISILVVLSFHLFHIESPLVLYEMQFGVGFLVATTILVLWDLDDPLHGAICVPNIPADWREELSTKPVMVE